MNKYSIEGRISWSGRREIDIEFGRTQATMNFSSRGLMARALDLEEGEKVKVTVERITEE